MASPINVRDYWLERGKTYISEERLFGERFRQQEDFIIRTLTERGVPMGRILELGCGFGRMTRRLAEAFPEARIVAVDLSPDQIENARRHCADYADRITFMIHDIYSEMPLPPGPFDTAMAIEVFMHHPRPVVEYVVSELASVAQFVVNQDWSEEWSGPTGRHVWLHGYQKIYERMGLDCDVYLEPIKEGGMQQKLFIARGPAVEG